MNQLELIERMVRLTKLGSPLSFLSLAIFPIHLFLAICQPTILRAGSPLSQALVLVSQSYAPNLKA